LIFEHVTIFDQIFFRASFRNCFSNFIWIQHGGGTTAWPFRHWRYECRHISHSLWGLFQIWAKAVQLHTTTTIAAAAILNFVRVIYFRVSLNTTNALTKHEPVQCANATLKKFKVSMVGCAQFARGNSQPNNCCCWTCVAADHAYINLPSRWQGPCMNVWNKWPSSMWVSEVWLKWAVDVCWHVDCARLQRLCNDDTDLSSAPHARTHSHLLCGESCRSVVAQSIAAPAPL